MSKDSQLKTREQLRIVRHLLKSQPTHSTFFQQYAPLVDDWRNFLPDGAAATLMSLEGQTIQLGKVAREASVVLASTAKTLSASSAGTNQDDFQDTLDADRPIELPMTQSVTSQTEFTSASEGEFSLEASSAADPNERSPGRPSLTQRPVLATSSSHSIVMQEMMPELELRLLASASSPLLSPSRPNIAHLELDLLSANDADEEDEDGRVDTSRVTSPISRTDCTTMPSLLAALTERESSSDYLITTMTIPQSSILSDPTSSHNRSNDGDNEYDG